MSLSYSVSLCVKHGFVSPLVHILRWTLWCFMETFFYFICNLEFLHLAAAPSISGWKDLYFSLVSARAFDEFFLTFPEYGCGGLVAQSCPTLSDPVDSSPPGFPVHGISQASILEWVAISFSEGSSQQRNPHLLHCRQSLALQAGSLPLCH